jgi:hypothetical protein
MKTLRAGLGLVLWLGIAAAAWAQTPSLAPNPALAYREVWAYVLSGEEGLVDASAGITDLAHFGAGISSQGELSGLPQFDALKGFRGRRHLVVAVQDNLALAHMALFPGFPVRGELLKALVQAAQPYDGLQLDFESVATKDKAHFLSFLADLRALLGSKRLSIAVPARTGPVDDAFDYRAVAPLVDRVIIMAYDEHWSGGPPGAVATLAWCRKVALYAQSVLSADTLVMGAPFYGRAWTDKSPAKAYRYSTVAKILDEKSIAAPLRIDAIPSFEFEELVKVKVFYEDRESQLARLKQYTELGVRNIAFWRLGQEDPTIWAALTPPVAPQ